MIRGILGKKIGMTQIFDEEGLVTPVTVLEAGPCVVQAVRTKDKNGYRSVQLGYDDAKEKSLNKPQREEAKKNNLAPKRFVREVPCDDESTVQIGVEITNKMFQVGDFLDVSGVSKGKGFQGGVRRHHWLGGAQTHGSMSHRAPGSIGSSSFPSRVFKGMRMAGHMGHDNVTTENLKVMAVDTGNNTIAVEGAVPGANGTYLVIKYAKKKPVQPRKEGSKAQAE